MESNEEYKFFGKNKIYEWKVKKSLDFAHVLNGGSILYLIKSINPNKSYW